LILLLGVLIWVRRLTREGLAFRPTRGAHWLAAFYPLLVVALFGWARLVESRQQAARKEQASKKEAWHQAV
jgi:hypothetical protein